MLLCIYLPLSGLPAAHGAFEMKLKGNNWQQSARRGLKCHYCRRKPSKFPFSGGLARAAAHGDCWKPSSPGSNLHAVTYLLSFIYMHTREHTGVWIYCEFCMSVLQARSDIGFPKLSPPSSCRSRSAATRWSRVWALQHQPFWPLDVLASYQVHQ